MTPELKAATLDKGICPSCLSSACDIRPDYISCRTCGLHGDPVTMWWCETVPVFRIVAKEDVWQVSGQLYKYREALFGLVGYSPGCGRAVASKFCDSCRSFLPEPIERPQRGKNKDGKAAAAGEDREVEV